MPRVAQAEAADRPWRIVHDVRIEVSIPVVIEECGVRRVTLVCEPVPGRRLGEGRHSVGSVSLMDVQLVRATRGRQPAGVADVEVQQPVAVHVREGHAGRPGIPADQPGRFRHIAEPEAALVQVQAEPLLVGGEEQLRQPVTGEVAERDAAAVVVVAVGEDVQLARVHEAVLECDAGVRRRQLREEPAIGSGRLAQARIHGARRARAACDEDG